MVDGNFAIADFYNHRILFGNKGDWISFGKEGKAEGEFYYPTYRTECTSYTDANGNTRTSCRQVFDGYQYTHAAIAAFDEKGNKKYKDDYKLGTRIKHQIFDKQK